MSEPTGKLKFAYSSIKRLQDKLDKCNAHSGTLVDTVDGIEIANTLLQAKLKEAEDQISIGNVILITELKEAETNFSRLHESSLKVEAENVRLREALDSIQTLVDEQAEDEGLWFKADYAAEAYVQHHLRLLHEVIEGSK